MLSKANKKFSKTKTVELPMIINFKAYALFQYTYSL